MNALLKVFVLVFTVATLLACGGGEVVPVAAAEDATTGRMKILSVASDGVMSVQLPFPDGVARECYQNSHDTPTHSVSSTMSDLDFSMPVGSIVVAAAGGTVHIHDDATKTGGFGWYVAVDHGSYWTIYAHLSGFIATEGQQVVAGQPIAYSGGKTGHPGAGTSTGAHLHFGVHSGSGVGTSQRMAVYALNRNTGILGYFVTGNGTAGSDFMCAVFSSDGKTKLASGHFYESRPIGAVFSEFSCEAVSGGGVLCWKGNPVDCVDGNSHVWYHKNSEGAYLSESNASTWQKCLQTTGSTNLLAYLDGGYGVGGVGFGTETEATDDQPDPPDFVVKKVWLQTPWGVEAYKFGLGENFDTKAQSKNDGDGPCLPGEPTTITGHFYLSKGYKEDVHSGDGAWRRVDSTTTQCSNLLPGDTHTETKNTVISQWITTPGIYNIVYCIDHPLDDHNNGGEHREKHESNNCSTEAVFEVTANQIENVPNVDLTVSGFTVLQAPVYAGDFIRLGAWVTNSGTVNATSDIRSRYGVSCNGAPETMLTDDGTMASTLTAGASAWEEILTPVQMPNVVGTCTLTFTADYLGAQAETDETNNSTSLTVTLALRPAPRLVITQFRDESGCCTTNTGSRIKPDIWVRNDGPVAPGANVTVIYHISSPVATGGAYALIGYGSIRPDELPSGKTDEDYMDTIWYIPKTSAWKYQWHTIRGCLKVDGSTPVGGGPGEVCAYYTRYSKS